MLISDENVKPTVVKFPIDEQGTVEISVENHSIETDSLEMPKGAEESLDIEMDSLPIQAIQVDIQEPKHIPNHEETIGTVELNVDSSIDVLDLKRNWTQSNVDETVSLDVADLSDLNENDLNDASHQNSIFNHQDDTDLAIELEKSSERLQSEPTESESVVMMFQNHDSIEETYEETQETQENYIEKTEMVLADADTQTTDVQVLSEEQAHSVLISEKNHHDTQETPLLVSENNPDDSEKNHQDWRLDPAGDEPLVQKEWSLDDVEAEENTFNQQNPAFIPKIPEKDSDDEAPILQSEPVSPILSLHKPNHVKIPHTSSGKPMRFRKIYGALLGAAVLTIWFSHQSINAYWQQTYHRESPLEFLNQFAFWRGGASVQNGASAVVQKTKESVQQETESVVVKDAQQASEQSKNADANPVNSMIEAQKNQTTPSHHAVQTQDMSHANDAMMTLKSGDKVIFAGDSIMQGIAPHLQRWLKQRYGIESHNLAKQSTGLAYPKFFDWPKTIEQAFQNDKDIKLLVILLGANDPWDFPNPKGGAYLKFQSEEWKQEYLSRVNRIIKAAEQADAKIIWVGIPFMKSDKLNTSMRYLDSILSEELQKHRERVLWLPVDTMLSDGAESYQDSITIESKPTRIRAKDGVHFNLQGQIFMSDYLASYLQYQE